MTNKIGWCDLTFNPVWGCRDHCEYCYARKIAKRFYNVIADKEYDYMYHKDKICEGEFANRLKHFVPTFINSQFDKKFPKKPQRIFVGSMSEIYYWDKVWIQKVIDKTKEYPQHTFQFLTKHPEVYSNWVFPKNCWLGVTMTERINLDSYNYFTNNNNIKYVSFEPLLNKMVFTSYLRHFDWVIIGAETGNRKGKVIPSLEWVSDIVNYCEKYKIPVYVKDSIKGWYPFKYKEFPKTK